MLDKAHQEFLKRHRAQEKKFLEGVLGTALYHRCPLDSEGDLISANIVETGERIFYCDECEAIWRSSEPLDEAHADSFYTFVLANGKRGFTVADILIG